MASVIIWVLMIVSPSPDVDNLIFIFNNESLCKKMSMIEPVKPNSNLIDPSTKCIKMKLILPEDDSAYILTKS